VYSVNTISVLCGDSIYRYEEIGKTFVFCLLLLMLFTLVNTHIILRVDHAHDPFEPFEPTANSAYIVLLESLVIPSAVLFAPNVLCTLVCTTQTRMYDDDDDDDDDDDKIGIIRPYYIIMITHARNVYGILLAVWCSHVCIFVCVYTGRLIIETRALCHSYVR